jgi:hypothetical protein
MTVGFRLGRHRWYLLPLLDAAFCQLLVSFGTKLISAQWPVLGQDDVKGFSAL